MKKISVKFIGNFREIWKKSWENLMEIMEEFERNLKVITQKFKGNFKKIYDDFRDMNKMFEVNTMENLKKEIKMKIWSPHFPKILLYQVIKLHNVKYTLKMLKCWNEKNIWGHLGRSEFVNFFYHLNYVAHSSGEPKNVVEYGFFYFYVHWQ